MQNSIIALIYRKIGRSHLDFLAGSTGRADENDSGVGLGSSTIHVTVLVKRLVVRLAWLVSHLDREVFWGVRSTFA